MREELALLDGSNVIFNLLDPVLVKEEPGLCDIEQQSEQQRECLAQLQQEFQQVQVVKAGAPGK
ncbi:hypothetical protein A6R68_17275, partial [Neotoma lepida]